MGLDLVVEACARPGQETEWRRLVERSFADETLSEAVAETLTAFAGYHVVRLVPCEGVPKYSSGGLHDGVDETSFRGEFLKACGNVLDQRLVDAAWEHKMPEAAIDYGRALLAAADAAETSPRPMRRSIMARLGLAGSSERLALREQIEVVRSAGAWFVFWGERGHPIRACF